MAYWVLPFKLVSSHFLTEVIWSAPACLLTSNRSCQYHYAPMGWSRFRDRQIRCQRYLTGFKPEKFPTEKLLQTPCRRYFSAERWRNGRISCITGAEMAGMDCWIVGLLDWFDWFDWVDCSIDSIESIFRLIRLSRLFRLFDWSDWVDCSIDSILNVRRLVSLIGSFEPIQ